MTLAISATDDFGVTGYFAAESDVAPTVSDPGWTVVPNVATYAATVNFVLSPGDGPKTVKVWFRDGAFGNGAVSAVASDSITLQAGSTVQGVLIDFETYPPNDRPLGSVPVCNQFTSLGVYFSFAGGTNGSGCPYGYKPLGGTNHFLTNDKNSAAGGYNTGVIQMHFTAFTTVVEFDLWWAGTVFHQIDAFDLNGQQLPAWAVLRGPEGASQHITITNAGGVREVHVYTSIAQTFLDDLGF